MSGQVLIVDEVATNRIVLKVKLASAKYDVVQSMSVKDAIAQIDQKCPDVVVMDLGFPDLGAVTLCQHIRTSFPDVPIIVTATHETSDDKIAAFAAGADEVLLKPLNETLLLARIRSLLRAKDAASELKLRDDTKRALGFAEQATNFEAPSTVSLITAPPAASQRWTSVLTSVSGIKTIKLHIDDVFEVGSGASHSDVFVLDAASLSTVRAMQLVSELRSRKDTRLATIVVVLSDTQPDIAAMALDLGANDVLPYPFEDQELRLRIHTQVRRKQQQDRLRKGVSDGLNAAVTDPLTGLFNRRYAMPHLERIAERAKESGREFAVMMLDIDHFKSVNDKYGHRAGDAVLIEVARRLRNNLRLIDLIARVGGEEFLVTLPETTQEEAEIAAQRLRSVVDDTPFHIPQLGMPVPVPVTLSIGVAMSGDEALLTPPFDHLFGRADAALYSAKNAGRNTVEISASAA